MEELNIFAFADEASPLIDGQIQAMKRNHLDGLEIRNVDNVNVADITLEKAREVRKKLEDNKLRVWSVGSPIGKIDVVKDNFQEHIEKFKHVLEITNELKAENIRLFSFYMPENKNPADYRNEVIERLGAFVDIAKGSGIDLCHENEKGIYGDTVARCLEIFKAIPQMKGIFDPANFVQCEEDTLKAWEVLQPYIKYLHIKDAMENGSIVPAGKGIGNIPELIAAYQRMGGSAITMEPHLAVFEGLAGLEREGGQSNVGEYAYNSNDEAFDVACEAVRNILQTV